MPDASGFTVEETGTPAPVWVDSGGWSEGAIPQRPWIARGYLLRGAVSVISGASSVSKSTLAVGYAVALALHRPFNRFVPLMACRVLTYNVEDDAAEQRRRFSAVLRQFDASPAALAGKVMRVGPNDVGTLIARDPESRTLVLTAAMVELQRLIVEFKPHVLILDPLVELHTEEENDNTALRSIMAQFRTLAVQHDMAVAIVHHARKGASQATPGDTDTLRGASSIVGAARIVVTVAGMTEDEGKAFGLSGDQRRSFFRVDSGKSNYSRLHEAEWFERVEYELDNGDLVAAPVAWQPPQDAVSPETRFAVEADIAAGSASGPWAAKLSKDARSIRQLFIRHGVTTSGGQQILLEELLSGGCEIATFRRSNRGTAQGLRTADGRPGNVVWLASSTCTDQPEIEP
jgi:hypothetical protein